MVTLVTGGTGFVGRRLVQRLLDSGQQVLVTPWGSEPLPPGAEPVRYQHDIIGGAAVPRVDRVYHLAACNDTQQKDRAAMFRANVWDPIVLFDRLMRAGCRSFVYASSAAVYGNAPTPFNSSTVPAPLNVYAESKLAFDQFAMDFATRYSCLVAGLRYCNVYGPGESAKGQRMSMIGQILRKALAHQPVQLFRDGNQRRDWLYVDDAVDAALLAGQAGATGVYDIGASEAPTFHELLALIAVHVQPDVEWVDCHFEDSYQKHTFCDVSAATRAFGYRPRTTVAEGIRKYFDALGGYGFNNTAAVLPTPV